MKIFASCLLAASVICASAQTTPSSPDLNSRQFDHVRVGEPVSELPFPCHILCEGIVGTHWFKINEKDHYVQMFAVVYNGRKISGEAVASHTLELEDAMREHSFANSHARSILAAVEDADGNITAWVDLSLKIVYLKDPADPKKEITQVVYAQPDAPIFVRAKRIPLLDKLADAYYLTFVEMEKRGYPHQ